MIGIYWPFYNTMAQYLLFLIFLKIFMLRYFLHVTMSFIMIAIMK